VATSSKELFGSLNQGRLRLVLVLDDATEELVRMNNDMWGQNGLSLLPRLRDEGFSISRDLQFQRFFGCLVFGLTFRPLLVFVHVPEIDHST
jgi:hypothetical protein